MKLNAKSTARHLARVSSLKPVLALVLGSGFHSVLEAIEVTAAIGYEKLPGFSPTGVKGHQGVAVFGHLAKTPILALCGRTHYYEGYDAVQITFPIRVLAELGIRDLIFTNAAGGIHSRLNPGDFMVAEDHINFMGVNPLRGKFPADENRFVDLTETYDSRLRGMLKQAARRADVKLATGVYLAVSGPSYETPAEIRAFARWGADAVGMSTVLEAIVARQCGIAVAALSCITNRAAGIDGKKLSHEGVLRQSDHVKHSSRKLLEQFAKAYGQE